MNLITRLMLPGLLLAGRLCAGPDPWDQLKPGMSREAAMALLGTPLFQTRGHGMETWIYEHGAEVVIHGSVMAWTLPTREPLAIPDPLPAPASAAKTLAKPQISLPVAVPAPALLPQIAPAPPLAAAPLPKPPVLTKPENVPPPDREETLDFFNEHSKTRPE